MNDRSAQSVPADPRSSLPQAVAAGALAGAAATLVMSLVMLPAKWVGLLGTQPPRRIADRMIEASGGGWRTPEPVRRLGTTLVHLATGAGCGAAFGVARSRSGGAGSPAVVGPAFGAGIWSVAYLIAAPALKLLPPPDRDRPARPQVMFVAHLLYGFVTATLFDRAVQRRAARPGRSEQVLADHQRADHVVGREPAGVAGRCRCTPSTRATEMQPGSGPGRPDATFRA